MPKRVTKQTARQAKYATAHEIVKATIRSDRGLYEAFQANIAMAVIDRARWENAQNDRKGRPISWTQLREIANKAADDFLQQWTA